MSNEKVEGASCFSISEFVFSCAWCALIIVGGFISIPIGVVPVALADFFVMLSSSLQTPLYALFSASLYVILGIIGFPVFANGKAGLSVVLGPTGGFVIGYIIMAAFISLLLKVKFKKPYKNTILYFLTLIFANIILYTLGVLGLMLNAKLSFTKALAVGVIPFLIGTLVKISVSFSVWKIVKKWKN